VQAKAKVWKAMVYNPTMSSSFNEYGGRSVSTCLGIRPTHLTPTGKIRDIGYIATQNLWDKDEILHSMKADVTWRLIRCCTETIQNLE